MPFVKKNDAKGAPLNDAQKIFVGRTNELNFFAEHILKPEDPAFNILSLYGDGGVGKSTLINRYIEMINAPEYREYCLAAIVDERQATPASMMEKFTDQLHMRNEFKHALAHYKEALRKQRDEQETIQDAVLQRAPDFAGAAVEGVPIVGPLLRESLKVTTAQMLNRYHNGHPVLARLDDPVSDLTRAFVTELNRLAESLVTPGNAWRTKRHHRILLVFDTFEQLSAEAAPWLLDYFLEAEISSNVVILTAGRIPIDRSLPEDPKRWLPYRDNNTICTISLTSFTFEETRAYLLQRGIADPERIDRIWQISRGLPLYLSLLTSDPASDVDPTTDVVANFLRWIPQGEQAKRRLVLDASLFSRPFNQDDLAAFAYIAEHERPAFYHWLTRQPFVHLSTQDGRYSYHELAEDLFSRHLYQRSPDACYTTRRALVVRYRAELDAHKAQGYEEYYRSPEWLSLLLALARQLFLLPDGANHRAAVERLLHAYDLTKQDEEIMRVLREISQVHLYNQANADARDMATLLLRYIEAEPMSQEQVTAIGALLRKIGDAATFSPTLLAHLYGNRGVAYRNLSAYQQAIEDFDRAIALDAAYAWAYGNRGITYRSSKNYERALADFNTAISLDNHLDWIYVARGDVQRHLGRYDRAVEDFDRAIALDPAYAQAYGSRGRVYRILGQYQQAIEDFKRAIALDPERAWFYAQQGENYRDVQQFERAIEAYNQAIALAPESFFWAYGSRGYTYFRLRNYQRAIEDYNRATELDPTYIWGYGQRGRIYRHLRMYDKALADFNRAIELDSSDAWAYSHRGLVYFYMGDNAHALADFKRAIELAPDYVNAYGRRGGAYLNLGDLEHARQDYTYNYTMAPRDTRACWLGTWTTLCQQRPTAQTVSVLEEAAARRPESYFAYFCRSVALWLRGEGEQALIELQEAQKARPTMWDAPFWLALIYGSEGRPEAVQALEQALQLGIPSVLLAPLHWLEEDQPAFYAQYLAPLL
ncbi:MAG: tetratricopeptide repeat protein [Chloroflexota bacterium]|nr:tetratricopeptide repeat protein [Chloroflexota bacterium]